MNENWNKGLTERFTQLEKQVGEIHSTLKDIDVAIKGDADRGVIGIAGTVRNLKSDVSALKVWRNYIVGASTVAWLVFSAFCWVAYDWLRENISTITEMVKHANKQ